MALAAVGCKRWLPRFDRLLRGAAFDPSAEDAAFRIAVSDNASQVSGLTKWAECGGGYVMHWRDQRLETWYYWKRGV